MLLIQCDPLGLAPLGLAPLGLAYLKIHSTHQFYTFSFRMPDDKSDAVTYRNGRFINNVFVPNDAAVPEEVTIAHRQPKSFDFDDFYQGRRPLMPDNMAMESRNDHGVFVEPPEEFKVWNFSY